MRKKILLSGYYGFDNAGDEAVLYAIVNSLRAQCGDELEITVLSNNPTQTEALYQVKAVDRWGKMAIFKAIKACDLLISGGGSLLQDVTSKNGILYYLGIIKLAQLLKKKVMIYAQGIGPITHKRNRQLTAGLLNKVQAITVRDLESRQTLLEMGVQNHILVGVDPVLGIKNALIDEVIGRDILAKNGWQPAGGPTLMVSLRLWRGDDAHSREMALVCDHFSARGWQVVFLPMHYPSDNEAGKKAAKLMHHPVLVLEGNYTPETTMALLKNADLILGMRLHALIMGAALGKLLVALSYDPKIDSFMRMIKSNACFAVESLDSAEIIKTAETLWGDRADQLVRLAQQMEIISKQAEAPAKIVQQMLGENQQ